MTFNKAHLNIIAVVMLMGTLVQAAVEIKAQFTGSIKTKIATETHFRHSLNCYVEKKGAETTAFPDQILSLNGGAQTLNSSGEVTWASDLYSPFSRHIRTLSLTASVEETPLQTKIGLQLTDSFSYQADMYGSNDCQHWNGITAPSDAATGGFIDISYKVPPNIWLLSIDRGKFNGMFTVKNIPHIEGSLNSADEILKNQKSYVWVTPNTSIILHLNFPQQVLGNLELLNS